MGLIRINKYLASLGVASRRKIDAITLEKRITINGQIAVPGDKINPESDTVVVDKKIIKPQSNNLVYYALNKPKYVLSTVSDDRGRDTVLNFVPGNPRVFPVGRLDYESTGLIILTNDGDLALKITHPRYHLPKVYLLTCIGKISPDKLDKFHNGIMLDDLPAGRQVVKTAPAKVEVLPSKLNQNQLKITLYEGKKRQIRRMCSHLHLHVLDLHRLSIGPVNLGELKPGQYRPLTRVEINSLKI